MYFVKFKKFTFRFVVTFIILSIGSLLYYLKKYYIETKLVFDNNQFLFYLGFVIVVVACFSYCIVQIIHSNKKITVLSGKLSELQNLLTSYHYSTLEAIDNTTEVVLDTHNMLKGKEMNKNA